MIPFARMKKPLMLCGFALLCILACRLTQEEKVEHTISVNALYDTLKVYDSVQIQLKDADGNFLGLLYHGKVETAGVLQNLQAPGYDGKTAIISITGYDGDAVVYRVDRVFNGATNQTEHIITQVSPTTELALDTGSLRLFQGDTVRWPGIKVSPDNLANKGLSWTSLDKDVLAVGDSTLIGLGRGSAKVSVKLKSDLSKELILTFTVLPNPQTPDSLFLSPETLFVAAKGAAKRIKTAFIPVTAKPGLSWHTSESSIALVSETGEVYGVNKGTARVWAVSTARAGLADTVVVSVSERVPVTGMRFVEDSLNLFLGGSTEPLVTAVAPAGANPEMDFSVVDDSKVELKDDRIKGIAKGGTWVIAASRDNPALKDSLRVEVLETAHIDRVEVIPATFQIYTGGKEFTLTGTVYPADAYPKVQWKSIDPAYATVDAQGRVSAVAPGSARIVAVSLADSTRKDTAEALVKQDVPELTVGKDTTIFQGRSLTFTPVVKQDYGDIVSFWWDVDGEPGWDDSATALRPITYKYLKEKVHPVAFYVRDEERNWDTVRFNVTVKSSPMVVHIVNPGKDTLVNTPSFTLRYTVNNTAFSELLKLHNGGNMIVKDTSDEKGGGSDSVRITLDTTLPVIKITAPIANQAFNKDSVAVAWSIDGQVQTKQLSASLGTTDGKKDITREFTDEAGNKGTMTVSVFRDTKKPIVAITSPKDSSATKETRISVAWTADNVKQTGDTSATLTEGLNVIVRKSTDAAGNTDSASIRVYSYPKPPVVKILSPTNGTKTDKNKIVVSWTVNGLPQKTDTLQDLKADSNRVGREFTDPVGQKGTDTVIVLFNPNYPNVQISSPVSGTATNQSSIPVVWSINSSAQPVVSDSLPLEGENLITRSHKDSLGFEGSMTVKVIRDTKNPNAPTLSAPTTLITTANPTAKATWNWSSGGDNAGGSGTPTPKAYRYQLDGQSFVTLSAATFTLDNPADGAHTLVVQEQDKAENWSASSATVTITVDKTAPKAPAVTGTTPSSDPIWTWSGAGGGNGTFRFRLDGAAYAGTTTAKRFNPHEVTDADHTLYVEEQDDHGNWSTEKAWEIKMASAYPTLPVGGEPSCAEPGSAIDTVVAEMDTEGFRPIFDGKTFKGWWADCKTSHSSGSQTAPYFRIDPNSNALFATQNGTIGGVMMTNKIYANYEMILDIWPKYGNDAGIFHRSLAGGKCYQTTLDYYNASAMAGAWSEAGYTPSFDWRPFAFNGNEFTLAIPGNNNGPKSNWTTYTSALNPASFGCSSGGCAQADWANIWSTTGWNQVRMEVFGNITVKTYIRKFGSSVWVPVLDHTLVTTAPPTGYIGINTHGGGRFNGAPGNWYRNIKVRELDDAGKPVNLP